MNEQSDFRKADLPQAVSSSTAHWENTALGAQFIGDRHLANPLGRFGSIAVSGKKRAFNHEMAWKIVSIKISGAVVASIWVLRVVTHAVGILAILVAAQTGLGIASLDVAMRQAFAPDQRLVIVSEFGKDGRVVIQVAASVVKRKPLAPEKDRAANIFAFPELARGHLSGVAVEIEIPPIQDMSTPNVLHERLGLGRIHLPEEFVIRIMGFKLMRWPLVFGEFNACFACVVCHVPAPGQQPAMIEVNKGVARGRDACLPITGIASERRQAVEHRATDFVGLRSWKAPIPAVAAFPFHGFVRVHINAINK